MRDRFGIFGTVTRFRELSLLLVIMLRIPNIPLTHGAHTSASSPTSPTAPFPWTTTSRTPAPFPPRPLPPPRLALLSALELEPPPSPYFALSLPLSHSKRAVNRHQVRRDPPHTTPSNRAISAPILRASELHSFPAFFSIKFLAIRCLLAS